MFKGVGRKERLKLATQELKKMGLGKRRAINPPR